MALHPLLCAEMLAPPAWFEREPGVRGTLRAFGVGIAATELIRIPIVAFLVEHPSAGPIVIDTGFQRVVAEGAAAERNKNLGPIGRLMGRNIRMRPEQAVVEQLRARGIDPAGIELVVMTHLHFDHASALCDFPAATVIVSAAEWRAARARGSTLLGYPTAQLDPRPTYRTVDFSDPAARVRAGLDPVPPRPGLNDPPHARAAGPFEGTLDLLGDGSLVLASTPGHSTGHMSVIARLREGEALIAGDAIYTMATLHEGRRPWRSQDARAFERSVDALRAWEREHPDALIIPGHDMAHWETLAERYE